MPIRKYELYLIENVGAKTNLSNERKRKRNFIIDYNLHSDSRIFFGPKNILKLKLQETQGSVTEHRAQKCINQIRNVITMKATFQISRKIIII